MLSPSDVVEEIARLPVDWHLAGVAGKQVLSAIVKYAGSAPVAHSAETGSGKTTLLFSHLSRDHKVFAMEADNRSITAVRDSPLFNDGVVEFVEGPTQHTLPRYPFRHRLQIALIDGPHGYPFPELEYLCLYPQLDEDGLLIVDDIHIPTIHRLYEFLREEEMFSPLEVVGTTAFFRRTKAPMFDPQGDGWWLQNYNKTRFPFGEPNSARRRLLNWVPRPAKDALKRILHRAAS